MSYSSEDFDFDLPPGTDVCNISTFAIWCEVPGVFFTQLLVPDYLFVSAGSRALIVFASAKGIFGPIGKNF